MNKITPLRKPKPTAFPWAHSSDPKQTQGLCLGQRILEPWHCEGATHFLRDTCIFHRHLTCLGISTGLTKYFYSGDMLGTQNLFVEVLTTFSVDIPASTSAFSSTSGRLMNIAQALQVFKQKLAFCHNFCQKWYNCGWFCPGAKDSAL